MNLEEFETTYREAMDEALNELQAAILLLAQVQRKIYEIANSVQHLSESVEEYINNEKAK